MINQIITEIKEPLLTIILSIGIMVINSIIIRVHLQEKDKNVKIARLVYEFSLGSFIYGLIVISGKIFFVVLEAGNNLISIFTFLGIVICLMSLTLSFSLVARWIQGQKVARRDLSSPRQRKGNRNGG